MSYVFISPYYNVTRCPTNGEDQGMGAEFIGPDQPWTSENAGKFITPETRSCPRTSKRSHLPPTIGPPKYAHGGEMVPDTECYLTGRIREATAAGLSRREEWCCPRRTYAPKRVLTAEEADRYLSLGVCNPITMVSTGEEYPSDPEWRDKNAYVPSTCHTTSVYDGEYRLICCKRREAGKVRYVMPEGGITFAAPTAAMIEEQAQEREQRIAETERMLIETAEPEYGFFQRYGVFLLLGAGALGIGVTAGLVKRARSKKDEE